MWASPWLPVGRRQRWTTSYPLALLYRLTRPSPIIAKALFDTLLGADAIEAQPERAADMVGAFQRADRGSIQATIRFMHHWQPLTEKLPAITAPTLFLTGTSMAKSGRLPAPKPPQQPCPPRGLSR